MPSKLQKERRKNVAMMIRIRKDATFTQRCWRRLLARKELQRLQKEAKELSIQLVLVRESIFVWWVFRFPILVVPRYKLSLCHAPIKLDLLGFSGIDVFA